MAPNVDALGAIARSVAKMGAERVEWRATAADRDFARFQARATLFVTYEGSFRGRSEACKS